MKSIFALLVTVSIFVASNAWSYDFSASDRTWVKTTSEDVIEDLRSVGASSFCVWGKTDNTNQYMSAILRIVLKAVPATVSAPGVGDSSRLCVTLNALGR